MVDARQPHVSHRKWNQARHARSRAYAQAAAANAQAAAANAQVAVANAKLTAAKDRIESLLEMRNDFTETNLLLMLELEEKRVELEQAKLPHFGRCSVCLSERADHMALPCGHLCACPACSYEVRKSSQACPICRKPVSRWQRVHFCSEA